MRRLWQQQSLASRTDADNFTERATNQYRLWAERQTHVVREQCYFLHGGRRLERERAYERKHGGDADDCRR